MFALFYLDEQKKVGVFFAKHINGFSYITQVLYIVFGLAITRIEPGWEKRGINHFCNHQVNTLNHVTRVYLHIVFKVKHIMIFDFEIYEILLLPF